MLYQRAYLHLFTRITDVIEQMEKLKQGEEINLPLLLRQIQGESEEIILSAKPIRVSRSGNSL